MVTTVPGAVNSHLPQASDGDASSKPVHPAVPVDLELSSLESLDPQPSPPRTQEVNIDVNEVLSGGNENGYAAVEHPETYTLPTNGELTNATTIASPPIPSPANTTPAIEEKRSAAGNTARDEMEIEMNIAMEPSEALPPKQSMYEEAIAEGQTQDEAPASEAHDLPSPVPIEESTDNEIVVRALTSSPAKEQLSKDEPAPSDAQDIPPLIPVEEGTDNGSAIFGQAPDVGNRAVKEGEARTATAVIEPTTLSHVPPPTPANSMPVIGEQVSEGAATAQINIHPSKETALPPLSPQTEPVEAAVVREAVPEDEVTDMVPTIREPLLSRPPPTPQRLLEENVGSTDVLTEITEDPPPSVPVSVLPTAARVPIPPISEDGPVDVYLSSTVPIPSSAAAYIWNAADALRLRREYRLIGDWLGTLPKHTAQNQYLSVPLALSYDELHFGYTHGFLRVFDHSPHDYPKATEGDVAEFYQGREDDVDRHTTELEEHQKKQKLKRATLSAGNRQKRTAADGQNVEAEGTDVERKTLTGKKRKRSSASSDAVDETTVETRRKANRNNTGSRTFIGRVTGMVSNVFSHLFSGLFRRGQSHTENGDTSMEMQPGRNETSSEPEAIELEIEKAKLEKEAKRRRMQARASTMVVTPCEAREAVERVEWDGDLPPTDMPPKRVKQRAAVFKDLYTRGYAMSCGAKFGADLLAYAGDPHLFHAALSVVVLEGSDAEVSMHELIALGRLGDSTKKRTVLAYRGADRKEVKYVGVQWEENLP